MKKVYVLFFIMSIVGCSENDSSGPIEQEKITKKEVHNTIKNWAQAMLENQLEPQEDILNDTWIYSGSKDGTTTTKMKAMADFRAGETNLKGITLQDTIIRIYGDIAILTGKEELLFVTEKDSNKVHLRFTDVFMKEDGKVTALSTHSSPIVPNGSAK